MYLPKHFEAPSREAIESLVRDYPLAQVVTIDADGQWVCNPLPLLVRGQLIAKEDISKKLAAVTDLTDVAEKNHSSQPRPWSVADAPEDFVQANLRAIVAIEIRIESVVAKFKLSQNRTFADRGGVMDYFAKRDSDQDAAAMLKLMQSIADKKTNKS